MTEAQPKTTGFPTVEQWQREADRATPRCPSCGRHLGIRLAMWNASNRDEWTCDEGCNGNGQ